MPQIDPQDKRHKAYAAVLATEDGCEVLADLVRFAQAPDISEARALGRADVVLRFERENKQGRDVAKPRRVVGGASTAGHSAEQQETEE